MSWAAKKFLHIIAYKSVELLVDQKPKWSAIRSKTYLQDCRNWWNSLLDVGQKLRNFSELACICI